MLPFNSTITDTKSLRNKNEACHLIDMRTFRESASAAVLRIHKAISYSDYPYKYTYRLVLELEMA